jgi:erythronate-4-phosphate dehydrogenase
MSVQALSRFFQLGIDDWEPEDIPEPSVSILHCNGKNKSFQQIATELIFQCYDFEVDQKKLKEQPEQFERLRENYPIRREFNAFTVYSSNLSEAYKSKLKSLGFHIQP